MKIYFKKYLFLILGGLFMLSACGSENEEPTPQEEETGKRLVRIEISEQGETAPFVNNNIAYNASGQLESLTLVESDGFTILVDFSYENNQVVKATATEQGEIVGEFFYQYQDGRLSGYRIEEFGDIVDDAAFRYDNAGNLSQVTLFPSDPNSSITYNTELDAQGNVTKFVGIQESAGTEVSFTYDDRINPLQGLPYGLFVLLDGVEVPQYFSPNNVLNASVDFFGGGSDSFGFTYEYDAEGYPTKVIENIDFLALETRYFYE